MTPGAGPSWPMDLCLNKLGKGPLGMQCYIQYFKHLSQVILKKKISEYFYVFLWFNLGPMEGSSWTWELRLNTFG